MDDKREQAAGPDGPADQTWHYRGYSLRPSEFTTAMVHLYRGEVARSNTWRTRLDLTTNWAVVTIAAMLTFVFGTVDHHHVVLLLAVPLNALFLLIESRRYRYYELWTLRVRLMETDFFGAMLAPPFGPSEDWARLLNQTLLTPRFPISLLEAIGRRLRHNYLGIFFMILGAWLIKLSIHPEIVGSWPELVSRARVGPVAGGAVLASVAAVYLALVVVSLVTRGLRESPGEVLDRYDGQDFTAGKWSRLWSLKPRKDLVVIVTRRRREVADQLLHLLRRGVTALDGTGMWTGEPRSVLLCGIRQSEIAYLRSLVQAVDPEAFIVVNVTRDILGTRFDELLPSWRRPAEPAPPAAGGRGEQGREP